MREAALVVVDIQNDYFPTGAMPLTGVERAAQRAASALAHARSHDMPIIVVQHVAREREAAFFRPNTAGVDIHPAFVPRPEELHVVKHFPNAFAHTGLNDRLQQLHVRELVMVGMMTHMCIDSSVRAACDLGYEVTLLHDATATRDLSFANRVTSAALVQTTILAALHQTFAQVMSVAEWSR